MGHYRTDQGHRSHRSMTLSRQAKSCIREPNRVSTYAPARTSLPDPSSIQQKQKFWMLQNNKQNISRMLKHKRGKRFSHCGCRLKVDGKYLGIAPKFLKSMEFQNEISAPVRQPEQNVTFFNNLPIAAGASLQGKVVGRRLDLLSWARDRSTAPPSPNDA